MKIISLVTLVLSFFFFEKSCAHIFMKDPPSRRNKYSKYYIDNNLVDYNLMAPLLFDGYSYPFPCKGYQKGPFTKVYSGSGTGTGIVINITLEGSATHGGGHCQFGLSFDDSTFVVLKTVLSNCLLDTLNFNMEIPNDTFGNVTLFWTWINRLGNREYYMECSDIYIENPNASVGTNKISGKELVIFNYPGYPILPEGLPNEIGTYEIQNAKYIETFGTSQGIVTVNASISMTTNKDTDIDTDTNKKCNE